MGHIFIGDPCNILSDSTYDEVWGKKLNFNDGDIFTDDEGENVLGCVHGTAFGDGEFEDSNGVLLPVDSGTLGIFDIDAVANYGDGVDRDYERLGDVIPTDGKPMSLDIDYDEDNGKFIFRWYDNSGYHTVSCVTGNETEDDW